MHGGPQNRCSGSNAPTSQRSQNLAYQDSGPTVGGTLCSVLQRCKGSLRNRGFERLLLGETVPAPS